MATADETQTAQKTAATTVNPVIDDGAQLGVRRYFTIPGRDPFDEVEWETRDAFIPGKDKPVFEQKGVEFPKFWSQTATNIVAQKFFLVHQLAAFNSPVWFNVGFEEKPQCSACQPYHALVSTPDGMVPIGELVEDEQVGREVYDANGATRIVAVKANGQKPVFRVTLRNGSFIEATPDHVVKAADEAGFSWLRVDHLRTGMKMQHFPLRVRELAGVGGSADVTGLEWTEAFSQEEIVSIEECGVQEVFDIQTESG